MPQSCSLFTTAPSDYIYTRQELHKEFILRVYEGFKCRVVNIDGAFYLAYSCQGCMYMPNGGVLPFASASSPSTPPLRVDT